MYYAFMNEASISSWLIDKFLDWQKQQGSLKTQDEFARFLGFEPSTVSMWINGKHNPDKNSVRQLATKLGPDIYDFFGIPRPPRLIHELEATYENIPEADQELFEEDFEVWLDHWLKAHGFKRTK